MNEYKSLLVTGCGGDIGGGVGRIIKEILPKARVIGADMSTEHAGRFIFDETVVLPRADSPTYTSALEQTVKKYEIECIVPTADGEIRFFAKSGARDIAGAPLLLANQKALEVGADKLATNIFLKENDLPHPWTAIVADEMPTEFPCIIKGRFGRGSKGVEKVEDAETAAFFAARRPADIWQAYVGSEDEEYTCGLYGCEDGSVRTIIMRRTLGGGVTIAGEVIENKEIESLLQSIASHLKLRGSINVQLRLMQMVPMVFEINPRFSSTVMFRHKLGFKDILWSLQENAGSVASPYTPPKTGTKFYKGYTEYIA